MSLVHMPVLFWMNIAMVPTMSFRAAVCMISLICDESRLPSNYFSWCIMCIGCISVLFELFHVLFVHFLIYPVLSTSIEFVTLDIYKNKFKE